MLRNYSEFNHFEIMAILRLVHKNKEPVSVGYDCREVLLHILKIDNTGFYIESSAPGDLKNGRFTFSIFSEGAKYSFVSGPDLEGRNNSGILGGVVKLAIPDEIMVCQRRVFSRLSVPDTNDFYCYGKTRDGYNYRLKIRDISNGGVSLLLNGNSPNILNSNYTLTAGSLLSAVTFCFGNYSTFKSDLDIISIKPNSANNGLILSCRFRIHSFALSELIDDTITKLTIALRK